MEQSVGSAPKEMQSMIKQKIPDGFADGRILQVGWGPGRDERAK